MEFTSHNCLSIIFCHYLFKQVFQSTAKKTNDEIGNCEIGRLSSNNGLPH